jgi:hypothetical protein
VDTSRYFVAVPAEELGESICARLEEIEKGRDHQKSAVVFAHLFGEGFGVGDGVLVGRKGDDGQLLDVNIKKAKALLESWVGLVLGPPKTWRCSARNADASSRGSVLLGNALMEFFWREDGYGIFADEWIKAGAALEEAYAFPRWDESLGDVVGASGQQLVLAGKLRCSIIQKWDVFFDSDYRSWEELPWVCVRTYENKWDLAALHPDAADNIINNDGEFLRSSLRLSHSERRDVVPVYRLFHRPSQAMPEGLEVKFLNAQTVLSVLPCEEIPLERFTPAVKFDTPYGDSQWTSTLGIEDLMDGVESAVASNYDAFGTQAIEMDSRVVVSRDRVNNLAVFERPAGMPPGQAVQPLQLARNPEGVDKYLSQKASDMAFVTGQNDVQLGQPDTAQMNAAAFAILKSAATERNSTSQRRAFDAIGRLGSKILRILARNITEEQALAIGGRAARLNYPMKKWTGADLEPISTCYVEVGNALEQSVAGRVQILTSLREAGVKMTAEDVQQVYETGRMESALQPAREESLLIEWENAEMMDGTTPVVHWAHNHLNHYLKHSCIASQPVALMDPKVMQQLEQHLAWHYREFWGLPEGVDPKTDPQYFDRVRIMLGQQAPSAIGPPPMGMDGTQPPAQGETSPAGGPQPASGPPSDSSGAVPPALSQPKSPEGDEGPAEIPSVLQ